MKDHEFAFTSAGGSYKSLVAETSAPSTACQPRQARERASAPQRPFEGGEPKVQGGLSSRSPARGRGAVASFAFDALG